MKKKMFFSLSLILLSLFAKAQNIKLDNTAGACNVWVRIFASDIGACDATYQSSVIALPPGAVTGFDMSAVPWAPGVTGPSTGVFYAIEFSSDDPDNPNPACTLNIDKLGNSCLGGPQTATIAADPLCNTCNSITGTWTEDLKTGDVLVTF